MKFHRTYHPKSWSKQARNLADRFLEWDDLDDAYRSLRNSYRHPRIRLRALKRFGRIRRHKHI